jgi:hypothetical protein
VGYGGTGYATVRVDIVQTDVDAIVQGITGTSGRTLTDLDNDLGNCLSNNGATAAAMLNWISNEIYSTNNALYDIANYLNGINHGTLYDGNSAVDYLNWISSNTSYLSNIDYGISSMKDCLYDYDGYQSAAALLADIRDLLQRFSFDGSGRLKVITT